MRLLKLIPDNTNVDFLRWRTDAIAISSLLLIASVA
jgi:preprotein translocase subunit SecF